VTPKLEQHNKEPLYNPLCRRCANSRNGRLILVGEQRHDVGPVHYMLDGSRTMMLVSHVKHPCRECGEETNRYFRPISISDLFTIEATGQINFIPRQQRRRTSL